MERGKAKRTNSGMCCSPSSIFPVPETLSEEAMIHANQKFKSRFSFVETSVKEGRGHFDDYSLDELEHFGNKRKGREKQ